MDVSKEDVVHAIALFDSNRFTFACMSDRDHRALPANAPARRHLANVEVSWVFKSRWELSLGRLHGPRLRNPRASYVPLRRRQQHHGTRQQLRRPATAEAITIHQAGLSCGAQVVTVLTRQD